MMSLPVAVCGNGWTRLFLFVASLTHVMVMWRMYIQMKMVDSPCMVPRERMVYFMQTGHRCLIITNCVTTMPVYLLRIAFCLYQKREDRWLSILSTGMISSIYGIMSR